jgi:hypothetical protein
MRQWVIAVVAVLGAATLPVDARAQCSVGCVSSSDCSGTGRAGCLTTCDGAGNCMCGDRKCEPQITRVMTSPEAVRFARQSGAEWSFNVYLITDCRGGVVGVQVSDGMNRAVQLAPAEILLSLPDEERSSGRVAAVRSGFPLVATSALRLREEE